MEPRAVVPPGEERTTMDVAKTMRATKATSLRALASEAYGFGGSASMLTSLARPSDMCTVEIARMCPNCRDRCEQLRM